MPRVLVIDDQEPVRDAIVAALTAQGFDAVAVEDGSTGLKEVETSHFDVAIVDMFMPGMDGLEVTKLLHQRKPFLPIIIASGFMFGGACPEMPHFDAMAMEAGAVSTLYKPFRAGQLSKAIQKAIGANAA